MIDWVEAQNKDPMDQVDTIRKGEIPKASPQGSCVHPGGIGIHQQAKVLGLGLWHKLYLNCKLKGEAETTVVFIVLKVHRQKAIDGCHQDAGHQSQNWTTSLLLQWFWWPRVMLEVKSAV